MGATLKEFWIYLPSDQGCCHVVVLEARRVVRESTDTIKANGIPIKFTGQEVEHFEEAKKETHHRMIRGSDLS